MVIDGVDISTFGLALSRLDDHLNQPKRKKVLQVPAFQANDNKFESKEALIHLVGVYPSKADMLTGIQGLQNLLKSSVLHTFIIPGHVVNFSGVVAEGMSVKATKRLAQLYFKVTIQE